MWTGLLHLLARRSTIIYLRTNHYSVTQRNVSTKAEVLGNSEHSNLVLDHSRFVSEASKKDRWKEPEGSKVTEHKDIHRGNQHSAQTMRYRLIYYLGKI